MYYVSFILNSCEVRWVDIIEEAVIKYFFIKYFYIIKVVHSYGNFHLVEEYRYKEKFSMKRDEEKFPSFDPTSLVFQR